MSFTNWLWLIMFSSLQAAAQAALVSPMLPGAFSWQTTGTLFLSGFVIALLNKLAQTPIPQLPSTTTTWIPTEKSGLPLVTKTTTTPEVTNDPAN